jgi:hypothetical protein
MARDNAKERTEASTMATTSVSSMPFPNGIAGSTVVIPATSGEDEEEYIPFAKIMGATGMRRKRSAESDDGNLSVSTKPATKKRAVTKAVYVEIPVPSVNVSVGIALTLMSTD